MKRQTKYLSYMEWLSGLVQDCFVSLLFDRQQALKSVPNFLLFSVVRSTHRMQGLVDRWLYSTNIDDLLKPKFCREPCAGAMWGRCHGADLLTWCCRTTNYSVWRVLEFRAPVIPSAFLLPLSISWHKKEPNQVREPGKRHIVIGAGCFGAINFEMFKVHNYKA